MNDQRKVIYEERRAIMEADNVTDMVTDLRHDKIAAMVQAAIPPHAYAEQWDIHGLKTEVMSVLALDLPIEEWAKEEGIADAEIADRIRAASDKKMADKVAKAGAAFFQQIEKSFVLRILDQHWKEHLLHLDHLRQGINLRAYAQRDPLNEYKAEAFAMFENMLAMMNTSIVQQLSLVEINIDEQAFANMVAQQRQAEEQEAQRTRTDPALAGTQDDAGDLPPPDNTVPFRRRFDPQDPATWEGNVSRNADCPCGSGKKFKHCHGKLT